LGLVWSFLNPILMLGLYVLVFGFIFRGRFQPQHEEPRIEYALIVFLGLAIYHFAAEVLGISPTLITSNPNFVKKVVFPLDVLPVATVGGALIHFFITLVLVFVGVLFTDVQLSTSALWLPVILVPLVLICVGLSLLLSALGVFWRDVTQITQFVLLILMFASAVFYPISQIPAPAWAILKFNPFIHVINEARNVTFWGQAPNAIHLVYLYVSALLTLAIGSTVFQRLRGSFADVL
jgi:lipopolysaccharide transport system permease protein